MVNDNSRGDAIAAPETRSISLSEAASRIAQMLYLLPEAVRDDAAELARGYITQIRILTDAGAATAIQDHGHAFAAGNSAALVNLAGMQHSSAHDAAISSGQCMLYFLWYRLDPVGRTVRKPQFLTMIADRLARGFFDDDALTPAERSVFYGDGLDPQLVIEHWDLAKSAIVGFLSPRWEMDFASVPALIEREAAAAARVLGAGSGKTYHVTLRQMAAIVSRGKRTLERMRADGKLPPPDVKGTNGTRDEWRWQKVRPILEKEFGRELPDRFPADQTI